MYLNEKLPELESPAKVDDPFSLEALISWLETKPPHEKYDYWDCDGMCLLGQFVTAQIGIRQVSYAQTLEIIGEKRRWEFVNVSSPHGYLTPEAVGTTFGAALRRAKRLKESSR